MEQNRIYKFDNIKVFMILGIVMEHALLVYGYPREIELVWGLCISCIMPLFTIISGYWYRAKKIKQIANSYLKPMMIISALNFIVGYFFYDNYSSANIKIIGYAMWYLVALFIFSSITTLLTRKIKIEVLVLLSFVLVACYAMRPTLGAAEQYFYVLSINRYFSFYPFYVLGILYHKYEQKINTFISPQINVILFFVSLLCYVVLCYVIKGYAYRSGFYVGSGYSLKGVFKFLSNYIPIILICFSLIGSVSNKEFWFTKYGTRTMNVYLLHMLVVFVLSYGIFKGMEFNMVNCCANVFLCIAICCLFFYDKLDVTQYINKIKWQYAIIMYCGALMLVNKSVIKHIVKLVIS